MGYATEKRMYMSARTKGAKTAPMRWPWCAQWACGIILGVFGKRKRERRRKTSTYSL